MDFGDLVSDVVPGLQLPGANHEYSAEGLANLEQT